MLRTVPDAAPLMFDIIILFSDISTRKAVGSSKQNRCLLVAALDGVLRAPVMRRVSVGWLTSEAPSHPSLVTVTSRSVSQHPVPFSSQHPHSVIVYLCMRLPSVLPHWRWVLCVGTVSESGIQNSKLCKEGRRMRKRKVEGRQALVIPTEVTITPSLNPYSML